jgi:hypothetical protein
MSIQQNFPSTRPSLNLNFSRSQKLDPRITFTRTSSATRVNSDGLIEVVPANSPRFDFDPISGECLGLLIEESRTNLVLRSEEFNEAYWTKGNSSITANAETSPAGTLSGDKVVEDASNNTHRVAATGVSVTSGTAYTLSLFAKAAERSVIELSFGSDSSAFPLTQAFFSLTGSGSFVSNGGTPNSVITNVGNGWYRCSISATASTTTPSGVIRIFVCNSTTTDSYQGDGTSGIYIWGAQLEVGSFPTSYIPTTTSTVTRTADNASITGSNFSDFYNPSEGTFNIKYNRSLLPIGPILGQNISTSSVLNGYLINQSGTGNVIITNADGLTNITVGTSSGGKSSVAFYYSPTGHSGCLNGNSVIESLVPPTRTPVSLLFGRNPNNNTNLNGHISQLTYYPTRLSNQVLQTLTK